MSLDSVTLSREEYQRLTDEIATLRRGSNQLQIIFQELAGLIERIEPNNENNRHCLEMVWGWLALADRVNPCPADPANLLHAIAQACHDVNRAYCQSIGDHSQLPWKQAPEWQQHNTIARVNFLLEHPEAGPETLYINDGKEDVANNWGQVPFELIKEEKKTQLCLFVASVRTLSHQAWGAALQRIQDKAA